MSTPSTPAVPQHPHAGKFGHPWLTPLSPGKTFAYNIVHRSLVTALVAFSAYAFFEVGRGTYFIIKHNRDTAAAQVRGSAWGLGTAPA